MYWARRDSSICRSSCCVSRGYCCLRRYRDYRCNRSALCVGVSLASTRETQTFSGSQAASSVIRAPEKAGASRCPRTSKSLRETAPQTWGSPGKATVAENVMNVGSEQVRRRPSCLLAGPFGTPQLWAEFALRLSKGFGSAADDPSARHQNRRVGFTWAHENDRRRCLGSWPVVPKCQRM